LTPINRVIAAIFLLVQLCLGDYYYLFFGHGLS